MLFLFIVTVTLTQCVCVAEYSPFQQTGNNQKVNTVFQNRAEAWNQQAQHTVQLQNAEPVRYTQFPETFPDYHVTPIVQQYYHPYETRPSEPTSGHMPGHVTSVFRPSGSKPDQVSDHHFLTRPLSIVSTPLGPHYLPHRFGSQLYPTHFDHVGEHPFLHQMPALGYGKPGITVIAKNIFIQNEIPQKYPGSVMPYKGIEYGEKPVLGTLDSKSSLLNRLLSSTKPRDIFLDATLEMVDLPTSHGPFDFEKSGIFPKPLEPLNVLGTMSRPTTLSVETSQNRPLVETVRHPSTSPFACKFSNCLPHSAFFHINNAVTGNKVMPTSQKEEKETSKELVDFHPLLNPSEIVQHKADADNMIEKTVENGIDKGKPDYKKTVLTVTTGLDKMAAVDKMAAEHGQQVPILASVEEIINETED